MTTVHVLTIYNTSDVIIAGPMHCGSANAARDRMRRWGDFKMKRTDKSTGAEHYHRPVKVQGKNVQPALRATIRPL